MARQKVWKAGLYQGIWVTTKGQVFKCGPDDLKFFHDRTKSMLATGAAIPWTYEHQQDEDSDSVGLSSSDFLARWAKNTGGHIHDVRIGENGPLEFLMDVDDADKPKLESIKFVSPDIRHNWRDRNGPEFDKHGPFWPGQSIAHLAVTPMPVQYPQEPFRFDSEPVSLSGAAVSVSLSSAVLRPSDKAKDKEMPFPPKNDDESNQPPEPKEEGSDPEGGGPIADPEPTEPASGGMNKDAHLIGELSQIVKPLGVEVHISPEMSLTDYVEHLCTAFKTHQATKGTEGEPDETNPQDAQNNPNQPQEPEIAENAPIMMSAATPLSDREKKMAAIIQKQSIAGLTARVAVLFKAGFIDDKIRGELANQLGSVQLSMSDTGDLLPTHVAIRIEAYERQMSANGGKPGPFGPPSRAAAPAQRPKLNKPISSAIQLSAAPDEVVEEPQGRVKASDGTADPEVMNRLTGGRYKSYQAKKKAETDAA